MKTTLTRNGQSVSLVLEEPLLDQLGLNDGAEVEVSANGAALVVTAVHGELRAVLDEIHEEYGNVFRRLAE